MDSNEMIGWSDTCQHFGHAENCTCPAKCICRAPGGSCSGPRLVIDEQAAKARLEEALDKIGVKT